jgi:DNA ligase 1
MLLVEVVTTSGVVTATRSRLAKVRALAGLLAQAGPAEIEPAVAFLSGTPRQGRTGTGYRTLYELATPPAAEPSLTVEQTDSVLEELSATGGKGSAQRRAELLTGLFGAATEPEQEFLRRLLTGELRQGALEGVMLDAIAAAAQVPAEPVRRAFMLSGRLPVTAVAALNGGEAALGEFRLEVGRPVRPMLASPAESLSAALGELGVCIVEYKMDGAPFQETMSRFGATSERELLLRPYFFDCLHLDGVDLLDVPLRERNEALHKAVGEHVIPGMVAPTADAAERLLADSLEAGHEGVMVKALDSVYAAGRRGKAWQKVKPEHTLDLVVLAAEWGHGRRTGYLSNLHLGARDPDGGPPIMVGKTFKGMTDELLAWQTRELQQIESRRDSWVVYVRPEFVVEIELDGAQTSPRYPGGVALRFARVLRYRPDKDPADADTIDAVRALLPGKGGSSGD